MLPFVQQIPNQPSSTVPGTSGPAGSTNLLSNPMQINPHLGFLNQQSPTPYNNNNPNMHMGNSTRPPGLMNMPNNFNALQNNHMGNSILGSTQQVQSHPGFVPQNFGHNLNVSGFPGNGQLGNLSHANVGQLFGQNPYQNGQFGWQNQQVQNMNQQVMLNPSHVAALAQLLGCANQVVAPQNTGFIANGQQLGLMQPNPGVVQQPNFGQQMPVVSQQMPAMSQQMQNVPNPASSNPPHSQSPRFQGKNGKGMHKSNSHQHQNKNSLGKPQRQPRFQKFQNHQMHNTMGKQKFHEDVAKGIKSFGPDNSAIQSDSGKQRSLSMLYTEKEIQLWREERKKNYPSKANVEKKLTNKQLNADIAEEEAKLRRKQLKEVLAKQAELGCEVAEIPSHYLWDPEDQHHGNERNKKPMQNGRFQNRFNKQGRFDQNNRFSKKRGTEGNGPLRRNERFVKRPRVEGDDSSNAPLTIKKPTLLQKLLSSDIKRDKSRLLQALRFMVTNSFFKDWPEQPLNFPQVIVRETEVHNEVIEQKPSSLESGSVDSDVSDGSDGEDNGCQEEGEITD